MTESNLPPQPSGPPMTNRKLPVPLWIAIAALGVITVLTLLSGLTHGRFVALVSAMCNLVLMFGLARGFKWAYVLVVVFSVLGAAVAFGKSGHHGLAVTLGNCVVLVPVLMSTSYFFPSRDPIQPAHLP